MTRADASSSRPSNTSRSLKVSRVSSCSGSLAYSSTATTTASPVASAGMRMAMAPSRKVSTSVTSLVRPGSSADVAR